MEETIMQALYKPFERLEKEGIIDSLDEGSITLTPKLMRIVWQKKTTSVINTDAKKIQTQNISKPKPAIYKNNNVLMHQWSNCVYTRKYL